MGVGAIPSMLAVLVLVFGPLSVGVILRLLGRRHPARVLAGFSTITGLGFTILFRYWSDGRGWPIVEVPFLLAIALWVGSAPNSPDTVAPKKRR